MKKTLAVLALLALLTLTACGGSNADALQQENETLRQQVAALESENENLKAENAALDDTAPESGDEEANPIDRFYDSVDDSSFSNADLSITADQWASAWEAECRNVAEWLKNQLPRQDEKDLVDGYITSAEEQILRMDAMAIWCISDLDQPLDQQKENSGTLRNVLWAGTYNQVWKDTFYQLLYVAPDYAGGIDSATSYRFLFDAETAQAQLDALLSGY